jgi:hypothetical protein
MPRKIFAPAEFDDALMNVEFQTIRSPIELEDGSRRISTGVRVILGKDFARDEPRSPGACMRTAARRR